jgi:hypothetical protein
MGTVELLLKDPLFWAAFILFLGSLSVFLWSLAGLRAQAAPKGYPASFSDLPAAPKDKKGRWSFPPPEPPPALPPSVMESAGRPSSPAAPPPPAPSSKDSSLVMSVMEEKFAEMAKRIAAVESGKKDQPPAYLAPLLKRVQDLEGDMKNLKNAFTQMAAAQNAVNVNELSAKISAMQKVLENLTGGTDVSKPS